MFEVLYMTFQVNKHHNFNMFAVNLLSGQKVITENTARKLMLD